MLKQISTLIFSVLVLTTSVFAQTKYVNTATINIRSAGVITSTNVIGQLHLCDELQVVSVAGDWTKVTAGNLTGYVFNKYLSDDCTQQESVPQTYAAPQSNSSDMVLICLSNSAYAYHKYMCSGLNRCTHGISKVTRSEAESRGYVPCKICY